MGRCLSGDGTNEALVRRKDAPDEEDHDTVSQSTSWGELQGTLDEWKELLVKNIA